MDRTSASSRAVGEASPGAVRRRHLIVEGWASPGIEDLHFDALPLPVDPAAIVRRWRLGEELAREQRIGWAAEGLVAYDRSHAENLPRGISCWLVVAEDDPRKRLAVALGCRSRRPDVRLPLTDDADERAAAATMRGLLS
nr:hypothetical protein [uncultured Azospirillum sp.]